MEPDAIPTTTSAPAPACRQCGASPLPPRRRSFCGPECVHAWRLAHDQGYARHQVWLRDLGVCAACRLDTAELKRRLKPLPARERTAALVKLGFHSQRSLWEADHVIERARGGATLGLANLQTLCQPCHRRKTTAFLRKGPAPPTGPPEPAPAPPGP